MFKSVFFIKSFLNNLDKKYKKMVKLALMLKREYIRKLVKKKYLLVAIDR